MRRLSSTGGLENLIYKFIGQNIENVTYNYPSIQNEAYYLQFMKSVVSNLKFRTSVIFF
jgi:hypothetical protein